MRYSVVLTVAAAEDFRRLDGSLKEPVAKQLRKLETAPRLGEHLGNRAGLDLTGYYKTLRSEEIDPYRVPDHRSRDPGRSRRDWKARRSRGLSGSPQAVKTPGSIGELFLCVLMKQLRSPSWPSDSKRGFTTEESHKFSFSISRKSKTSADVSRVRSGKSLRMSSSLIPEARYSNTS